MNKTEFDKLTFQDMRKMNVKQLKSIVSEQGQVANKRYDRIVSSSKTFKGAVNEAGGRFSVKGLNDIESLALEAKRIQNFNRSEFGTYKGAIQMTKDINNVTHNRSGSVKSAQSRKKKKKQKTLKQIKKDIQKKYKKVLEERGKEEAKKYRNRAMAQYERIRKKRAEERQKKREDKEAEKTQKSYHYDNEPDEPDISDTEEPEEPEKPMDYDQYKQELNNEINDMESHAKLISDKQEMSPIEQYMLEKQQEQEFMPTTSDEDWSDVFI